MIPRLSLVLAFLAAALAVSVAPAAAPVVAELRTQLPNGLTTTAVRYPGQGTVELALLVPAGAATQSSSLPGLARVVARHRAAVPGGGAPISVEDGAEWVVFRLGGQASDLPQLASRLARVVAAPDHPPEPFPGPTAADLCRDALYAALFPGHPLGNGVVAQGDLTSFLERGLGSRYTPQRSHLLIVGDIDPFEASDILGRELRGWPVSGAARAALEEPSPPAAGEKSVDLPSDAPPTLIVGGRLPPGERGAALVALRALGVELARRWTAAGLEGPPPAVRRDDGEVWIVGPWIASSPDTLDRAAGRVADALDGVVEGLDQAEVLRARDLLDAGLREPAPGGDAAGYMSLLVGSRSAGAPPGIAVEVAAIDDVSEEEVGRLVAGAFGQESRVIVLGRPRR